MSYKKTREDYNILYANTYAYLEGEGVIYIESCDINDGNLALRVKISKNKNGVFDKGVYVPVDDPKLDLEYPELGMTLDKKGISAVYNIRNDSKQYRRTLLLENITIRVLSEKEVTESQVGSSASGLLSHTNSLHSLENLFKRVLIDKDEALGRLRSGKAFSLPISKEYALVRNKLQEDVLLNKRGLNICKINSEDEVILPESIIQLREQIEDLGFTIKEAVS